MGKHIRERTNESAVTEQQQQQAPTNMARNDDHEDAVLGIAINTRNYRALLQQTSGSSSTAQAVATRDSETDGGGYNDNTVVGLAVSTGNYRALVQNARSPVAARTSDSRQNNNYGNYGNQKYNGYDDNAAVGLPVSTGNYRALLQNAASPVATRGIVSRHNNNNNSSNNNNGYEEDAAVGLPVSTGNYRSLLQSPPVATQAAQSYNNNNNNQKYNGYDDSAAVGLPVSTGNYRALLQAQGSPVVAQAIEHDDGGYNDNTVVGLPVATGNYVPIGGDASAHSKSRSTRSPIGAALRPPRSPVGNSPMRPPRSPVVDMGTVVEGEPRPSNQSDEDAVFGLPISSGNYAAMYHQDANQKVRPRGYSGLAGPSRDRTSSSGFGRQSNPEYGIAASSGDAASRSRAESCFDTRRTTGAVVPHKGWLYIQSPTMKAWKKYFGVLSGLDFRYSSEPGRASKGFGMVKSVELWDGKPCGLKFIYSSGSQVPAYCSSEQERDEWIAKVTKVLDKLQNSTGHSKTSYTLAADQHEGYLFKQERNKNWQLSFFTLRNDGYMQCRDDANSPVDARSSGFVKSVSFADMHPNALAIQLVSGNSVAVYADSYDDRMLWYAAISAAASVNDKALPSVTAIKSSYVQTALPNHSGWLYKQMGLFKSWKRVYITLHGLELSFSRDVNSPVEECEKIKSVDGWDGKQHGLQIRFASGHSWRVHAESYETAKHWRNMIGEACRHSDRFNVKRYIVGRKRKNLRPVFGGWLTAHKNGSRIRQFYVVDGNMLGVADDVDNLLQPIGSVVDIGATRDTANGMLAVFADGSRLKVSGDSKESAKAWYDCLSASL